LPLWEKVQVPYSVIQGLDDTFVPPGNADFAKEKLKNAPLVKWLIIEKMHHFVPWTHPQYIQEAILAHIEK
jgi:pimeloyl-ACP methyl ester carboxylesterase